MQSKPARRAIAQAGFRTSIVASVMPELLGVDYIIGPAIAFTRLSATLL